MYWLMNSAVHWLLLLLPASVQDLLWPGDRYEGMRFCCLCGRRKKQHIHCDGSGEKDLGCQETVLKASIGSAFPVWGISTQWLWEVWKTVDWHLCSPFLLQTLQKRLGFSKSYNLLEEMDPDSSISLESAVTPNTSIEWGGDSEIFCISETGKTLKFDLQTSPREEDQESLITGTNQHTECQLNYDTLLAPAVGLNQTQKDHVKSALETENESKTYYSSDEPQTDEDLTTDFGNLDDSVQSSLDVGLPTKDVWVPLQPGDGVGSSLVDWVNPEILDSAGVPLELDLGFGTFPGIECNGSHLGQAVITSRSAEDADPENGAVDGGSCSEDEYGRHDRHSGTATSGGENDGDELDQNWKPPDPDLVQKLIVQIEYYLSDENLEKDAFLLKHVRRNKMGFVSVKLLTSFKKVKHLTRDWRTTAYALRYSDILELNDDHRKIRRKTPVPVFPSENLPSKMLLVYDLHFIPELHCLTKEQENGGMQEKVMEQLLKTFRVFGVISSIRILKPGRDLPSDVKRFSSRYSQVGTKDCAIVEFEEVDAAIKAHESLNVESDTVGLKVILIGMKPPKKKIQRDRSKDEDAKNVRKGKSLNKRVEELQYVGDESAAYSSSEPDSNPNSPMVGRKMNSTNKLSPSAYPNNHLSPNASPRNSPWSSPCGQRKGVKQSPLADSMSPEFSRKCTEYSSDSSITPSSSPWVQRRRQAQTVTQEKSPACSPMLGRKIQNADGLPPGVLRLPRGPDGTKGFHNGGERNKPVQC